MKKKAFEITKDKFWSNFIFSWDKSGIMEKKVLSILIRVHMTLPHCWKISWGTFPILYFAGICITLLFRRRVRKLQWGSVWKYIWSFNTLKFSGIRNRRLQQEALQLLVTLLPSAHQDTLHALLSFLGEVADNCDDRQGSSGDLSHTFVFD